jgi:WhiB family redox-sensing transcriptional regulator
MDMTRKQLSLNTEWMRLGKCRDYPSDFFFPQDGKGVIACQRICTQCFVEDECLEYAIEMNADHGIWGGKSERERRKLGRAQRSLSA